MLRTNKDRRLNKLVLTNHLEPKMARIVNCERTNDSRIEINESGRKSPKSAVYIQNQRSEKVAIKNETIE
jgi:hypothetical protein